MVSLGVNLPLGKPDCIAGHIFSPHVNGSKTVLDSGFLAVDSGFQVLDFVFQSAGFRIPRARISLISESGLPFMGRICIPN